MSNMSNLSFNLPQKTKSTSSHRASDKTWHERMEKNHENIRTKKISRNIWSVIYMNDLNDCVRGSRAAASKWINISRTQEDFL